MSEDEILHLEWNHHLAVPDDPSLRYAPRIRKVPTFEECKRFMDITPPSETVKDRDKRAKEYHGKWLTTARYAKSVASEIQRMGSLFRPIHQYYLHDPDVGETPHGLPKPWGHWRRWPWTAVSKNLNVSHSPPWWGVGGDTYKMIKKCIEWLLAQPESHIPTVGVFFSKLTMPSPVEDMEHLPDGFLVYGFIPESIVDQFEPMRVRETLYFLQSIHGAPEWQRVRELLAAPTRQRIAEAYAIATGNKASKLRLGYSPIEEPTQKIRREDLSDTAMAIADAIAANPRQTALQLAEKLTGISKETIRKHLQKDTPLAKAGFRNIRGSGYVPPDGWEREGM